MRLAYLTLAFSLVSAFTLAQTPPPPPETLTEPPADAIREESGLIMQVLQPGTGTESPGSNDYATMYVTVWSNDGKIVQHTVAPKTLTIQLRNMLPGWRTAVSQMVVGEKRRTWVPDSLGGGKINEGEIFLIDTELIEIPRPHVAPDDVAAPPADAVVTESGLAYKVLREGVGEERPRRRSHVTVEYSGWTTDGKLFDSSILTGQPASFRLDEVIRGWTEGLQLMSRGEKVRFWIPSKLAYGRDRTKPQGTLVFDIELIDFRN